MRYKCMYGDMVSRRGMTIFPSFETAQLCADCIVHDDSEKQKPPMVDDLINHFVQLILWRKKRRNIPTKEEEDKVRRLVNVTTHVVYADDAALAFHALNFDVQVAVFKIEAEELRNEAVLMRKTRALTFATCLVIVLMIILAALS